MVTCPKCKRESDELDHWDCVGACNDNLICPDCQTEFDPDTGLIHDCDKSAELAAADRERGIECEGVAT